MSVSPRGRTSVLDVALVVLGGALGAAARELVGQLVHSPDAAIPAATLLVNLVGAVVLGLLLEALVRAGDDTGRRRHLRLLVGTGFCGGLTTYSTLAVQTDLLVRGHHPGTAVLYAVVSLLGGLLAVVVGIAGGAALAGRRAGRLPAIDPDAG